MEQNEDALQLGGNIELVGFRDQDAAEMIVLKKIVGNSVKKFTERTNNFEKFTLTLKKVHEREKSELFEIHARLLTDGKNYTTKMDDRNLFFAIDKCIKRIETEVFGK